MKVSQVHTACRNCVFATWDEKTQIGCMLNRIEAYERAGITVHEVYDDDDNEFFVIDGRFCLFYRTKDLQGDTPIDDYVNQVLQETVLPGHVIIFFRQDDNFDDLKTAIDAVWMPRVVTVVNQQYIAYVKDPDKYTKPSAILDYLNKKGFRNYYLRNITDEDISDLDIIDLVFDTSKTLPYTFYVCFETSKGVDTTFLRDIQAFVLNQMQQFGVILSEDGGIHKMAVSKIAHLKHSGNSFGVPLADKIRKYEEDGDRFVIPCQTIRTALSQKAGVSDS